MSTDAFRIPVAEHLLFQGRAGDPRLGEWVARGQIPFPIAKKIETIVLWGCPDDLGVTRNRGRAGAKEGPDSIRKHLYRMAMPMDLEWEGTIRLFDYGNLIPSTDINETQSRCREIVTDLARSGATLIALGGGHDFAAPNFLGFTDGRRALSAKETFGLINIDPHLDVRELEDGLPHSGTPFRQILDAKAIDGKSLVEFGARANRNSRAHYQYCRERKVTIHQLEELRRKNKSVPAQFKDSLGTLGRKRSLLGVTFDLDACSDAEGVSAAPVLGFSASELCEMAAIAGRERKVKHLELAEVAPPLDACERSSRIAAEMIYSFLRARAESFSTKTR